MEEVCDLIDAVREKDIQRVAQRILRSPPTLAVIGDVEGAPTLREIIGRL